MHSPPPYDVAINMDNLCPSPTAPLLTDGGSSSIPSLDQSLYPLPSTLHLRLDSDAKNIFYFRDSLNCMLIRGLLADNNFISFENANQEEFLRTRKIMYTIDDEDENSEIENMEFPINHKTTRLGIIKTTPKELNNISLINNYENNKSLSVKSSGENNKDLVISRARNTPPICTVNIPYCEDGVGNDSFNATIQFSTDIQLNKIEQCLCIATVVAFIITRNSIQQTKHSADCCKSTIFCLIVIVIIGVISMAFYAWLKDAECKAKPWRCKNEATKALYPN